MKKLLSTERFEWNIYSDNYGVELDNLIGESFDLVKSEIGRVISNALLADDRIIAVDNFEIKKEEGNILYISFVVSTIYGDIETSKEVVT